MAVTAPHIGYDERGQSNSCKSEFEFARLKHLRSGASEPRGSEDSLKIDQGRSLLRDTTKTFEFFWFERPHA
jgi:hypothetical protein